MKKHHLRIPGPTEVPEQVLRAMQAPMINHRGEEFTSLFKKVSEEIKEVFQTKNDVLVFPSAGTGAMEAAIANLFSPGDLIVSFSCGVFGDRFADIAEAFGARVERIKVEWGRPVTYEIVRERISKDTKKEIKGVLFTHNETSTGVLNDIKSLREAVGDHPALVIVDAISSLGAVELNTDEWQIDVVVAGSQKALMIPPGLGLVSVSERAWKAVEDSKMPKYYWNFKNAKKSLEKGETPYTPAVSLVYALEESLKQIFDEGLENIIMRHKLLAKALREGLKNLGFRLFAQDSWASPTVTAVDISDFQGKINFSKALKNRFNITVAGGQEKLKGKIIRIGHVGYVDELDIINVLSAIEMILADEELFGKGVKAAEKVFNEGVEV
ncbi:aspartate aminotransferase [Caldanaerovirga acetigignens]|uniref:Tritium exchange subunit n=1 Tax=Caldanaerovirga acetigignens TaxID=447595 RepID=A0A1M7HDE5_9FIRM|nr:alanine--glyoxylate aminotransferase family protein [Caldanaerovirga acetigignens]SHM26561.1 aspartate aminotransferase [Caldanaerovirga acetigignens]